MSVAERFRNRSLLLVLGEGGVGKTTVSAAIAGLCASAGRRVLVVTVDPSNRLKDSLGLSGAPGMEEAVPLKGFGPAAGQGSLHAMILDAATELDRLVDRLAPDEETKRRITGNVFYRKAAARVAGTHEYTAMERLLETLDSGRYDLIILDTPPERHALEFLQAPARLDALLGSDAFRMFVNASSGLSRLGVAAIRWRPLVLKGISRFAGEETFLAVLDFVLAFSPMFEGFRERAARVDEWLKGSGASTILVVRPEVGALSFASGTLKRLSERGIRPEAVVVNRVHAWPPEGCRSRPAETMDAGVLKDALLSESVLGLMDRSTLSALASDALRLATDYRALAREDEARISAMRETLAPVPVVSLPLLRGEVRDLSSLAAFAHVVERMFDQSAP